ncbi:DUF3325 domain-containing protein [Paracidovorax avenae]|uniref:DUF3325 domain-containing protein n=1 Tax=Paracidovorax avenae TaxID=80867 RepID=UPI000D16BC64|nr:DUF3325 domain-containing protein [Paracidovorax avenae]AVS91736.1 DUF3325 domain-containing protein [Paracidovorax avenae]AVT08988.1 DUF3325 domain-containing protein [Paracidovorax avenae]AVT19745.1 DUF3325 domain-containing protein [Paracidovorax avenae]
MLELLLCFAGWAGIALGMDRHHEDAWGREGAPARLRALRRAGWAVLALSLALAVAWPRMASVPLSVTWWAVALSVSALGATAAATWWPRRLPRLRIAALALAVLWAALTAALGPHATG